MKINKSHLITNFPKGSGNIRNILRGLEIFAKYNPTQWIAAEHDIIVGPSTKEIGISKKDEERLIRCGWINANFDEWTGDLWKKIC